MKSVELGSEGGVSLGALLRDSSQVRGGPWLDAERGGEVREPEGGLVSRQPGQRQACWNSPLASYKAGIGTGHDVTTTISQDLSGIPRPSQIFATEQATGVRLFDTNTYSYDGAGNILSMGPADTFAYDGRSRLTSASLSGLGSQYYCYDRFGNRVDKRSDPSCVPGTVWSDNRVPGAGNYDLRGNQTSNGAYSYDGLDRMTQQTAGAFTYLYDAANERLAKASSGAWTYTFRDEASHVSAEFTNASGITTTSQDNIFLGNLLVASYSNGQLSGSGPVWTFYSSDHLGTPRLLTKLDGSAFETRKYWPFGDDASGSTVQRLRFASMERDTEASRYYDHARSHEFNLGRFLSADPLSGNTAEPWTWNRYVYSVNNPVKYHDPDGLVWQISAQSPAAERQLYLREVSAAIGLPVYIDSAGNLQRAAGPPSPDHFEALQAVDTAINQREIIRVGLSEPKLGIIGDSYDTQTIIPQDLARFPERAPVSAPQSVTQGELITHIFSEYSWAASHGGFTPQNFRGAHEVIALDAQNRYRISNGQGAWANVQILNGGSSNPAYRACFSNGKCELRFLPR